MPLSTWARDRMAWLPEFSPHSRELLSLIAGRSQRRPGWVLMERGLQPKYADSGICLLPGSSSRAVNIISHQPLMVKVLLSVNYLPHSAIEKIQFLRKSSYMQIRFIPIYFKSLKAGNMLSLLLRIQTISWYDGSDFSCKNATFNSPLFCILAVFDPHDSTGSNMSHTVWASSLISLPSKSAFSSLS